MNENMTFEQQLARLEEIVAALERATRPWTDSLALFEEGTKRIAACSRELDAGGAAGGQADEGGRRRAGGAAL